MLKWRITVMSVLTWPGPSRMLRLELPKLGFAVEPAATKQLLLNQLVTAFAPSPVQLRLGRGDAELVLEKSGPRTANGEPVCTEVIPDPSPPPTTWLTMPPELRNCLP